MSGLAIAAAVLLMLACGATGGLALIFRARRMRQREAAYGIDTRHLQHIATGLGVTAGLIIGGLVLFFLQDTARFNTIEWIGRSSYMLVTAATAGHLLILARTILHLLKEEEAWFGAKRPADGTLGARRMSALQRAQAAAPALHRSESTRRPGAGRACRRSRNALAQQQARSGPHPVFTAISGLSAAYC